MDANVHGFDVVFRWPDTFESLIGRCIHFNQLGHVSIEGNITDDEHFKQLLIKSNPELDPMATTEERHENLTAAFTTGSMQARFLKDTECSE
jgi:hypothetical protein